MRRTWWIRLVFLFVLFAGLGAYLLYATPWRRWFGFTPDYSHLAARGNPIVAAVYQFHGDCGLWPQYLDDLAPDYLDAGDLAPPAHPQNATWFYELTPVPDDLAPSGVRILPSLSIRLPDAPRAHLGFDFAPGQPAWHFFGDVDERLADVHPAGPTLDQMQPARTLPLGQMAINALAEFDRRIAREPRDVEHRRAKAGLLMSLGRIAECRELVAQAAEDLPDSYWPRLARTALEFTHKDAPGTPATTLPAMVPQTRPGTLATGMSPRGIEELHAFAQWVQRRPSLTRWFYLSHVQRLAGQADAAAESMVNAVALPVELAADDPHITAYYLWDMTRWSLEAKRWPLTVDLADAWELAYRERLVADASYLPLRAAARLAAGNIPGARQDLAAFDALPAPRRAWARNIDTAGGLREAIDRENRTFHYSPGKTPGPFEVFPTPW